jgi:hypothetical protein
MRNPRSGDRARDRELDRALRLLRRGKDPARCSTSCLGGS